MSENGNTDLCLVQCTCADAAQAERISHAILEQGLAACVIQETVQSHYLWQGQITHSTEQRLSIKTLMRCWPQLEAAILALHSYAVPMIIATPLTAVHGPYADWLRHAVHAATDNTNGPPPHDGSA